MKIVSTTIVGPSGMKDLPEALASVQGVAEASIVIWTGDSAESVPTDSFREFKAIEWHWFPWIDDFSAARNEALEAAELHDATWAITLDSDERIDPRGEDIRAFLESTDAPVVLMRSADGSYAKPRAIRIPCAAKWRGPSHEALALQGPEFPRARFSELPKTPEQVRFKNERGLRLLTEYSKAHPKEARWHYYMGDQLAALGRYEDAIKAFDRCVALTKWDEEGAFAAYRAAVVALESLGNWREAYRRTVAALETYPWSCELAWLSAYAAYRGGWIWEAVRLASEPRPSPRQRASFQVLKASYEGPADILRFAFRELGLVAKANEAEKLYQERKRAREALLA